MNTQIISSVLGPLTQDERLDDWWNSEKIAIPLLGNKELAVTFMDYVPADDADFISHADAALRNFLALGPADTEPLKRPVWENYIDFKFAVGKNDLPRNIRNLKEDQAWAHVRPGSVGVQRGPGDHIYLVLYCSCPWETEHGLQLVFRHGHILSRVSDIDGHLTD